MTRIGVLALIGASILTALGGGAGVYHLTRSNSLPREELASQESKEGVKPVAFDGKRAMSYLEEICKIGPRISGSEGMRRQQELVTKHFEKFGARVALQTFTAQQLSQRQPVSMANVVITWHPERRRRVMLCSHYDTRPHADQEPDVRRWRDPFLSANDGGSGVAFLMEMAHHMKDLKPSLGVDFVLFDGEEYIFDRNRDEYFFGSKFFATGYKNSPPPHRYRSAILLDMIAGKEPKFYVEMNSKFLAGSLVDEVWSLAAELKCAAFVPHEKHEVQDDHLPLNRGGIPAIDIIDFDYPHWHRLTDLPAQCAPDGMEQVAKVLSVWLQRVK